MMRVRYAVILPLLYCSLALPVLGQSAPAELVYATYSPEPTLLVAYGIAADGVRDQNQNGVPDLVVSQFGRVFVVEGSDGSGLATIASPGEEWEDGFGESVYGLGGLYNDVLVGAHTTDIGAATDAGRAYVFVGGNSGWSQAWTLNSPSPKAYGHFGRSVSSAGDQNSDNVDDYLVGAYREGIGGRAHLFDGFTGVLDRTLTSPQEESGGHFGRAVAGGEISASLPPAVLVGAPGENERRGRAYVFLFGDFSNTVTIDSPDPTPDIGFGASVAFVGDVNRNGFNDFAVGAYGYNTLADMDCKVYVFDGFSGGLIRTLESPDPTLGPWFGAEIDGAGDVDGDGTPDIVVGAFSEYSAESSGRAHVFSGATGTLLATLKRPATCSLGCEMGRAVAGIGDVTGDGRSDIAVGMPGEDRGDEFTSGRLTVWQIPAPGTPAENEMLASSSGLRSIFPNPAATSATLRFDTSAPTPVRVTVFDVLGREVAVLSEEVQSSGTHDLRLGTEKWPTGVYTVRLEGGGETHSRSLTVLR